METMRLFKVLCEYGAVKCYLILGMDKLLQLPEWLKLVVVGMLQRRRSCISSWKLDLML